jgi:hypothetical protein
LITLVAMLIDGFAIVGVLDGQLWQGAALAVIVWTNGATVSRYLGSR